MMLLGLMLVIVSTLCQNNEGNQLIVKSDLMQRIWLWRGSCAGIAKRMTLTVNTKSNISCPDQ